jgi:2-dehydro-3-deoxyphosphogluconate aldolase/(4S)-4-hydroxy-2-oxoglutarate aldolase
MMTMDHLPSGEQPATGKVTGMHPTEIYELIRKEKVVAIIRGVSAETVINIANALYAGGIKLMEITCNTPNVMEMIHQVSCEMDGRMCIGAGTVITGDLAANAHQAGAKYIVAPDVNPDVIAYCRENRLAVIPGAATPTEILTAYRLGVRTIKIFPADGLGPRYIEQIRGPINDMDFIAVGGIDLQNIPVFINAGCAGVGVGSSLIRGEFIAQSNWPGLSDLAEKMIYAAHGD